MAELLFGKRLRKAEETLLDALLPGVGVDMRDDTMLRSILRRFIGDTQEHTVLQSVLQEYFGQLRENEFERPMHEQTPCSAQPAWEELWDKTQPIWAGQNESTAKWERQSFDTLSSIADRRGEMGEDDNSVRRAQPLGWGKGAADGADTGVSADMQKISDFFRRDSRRYDGGFIRY